MTVLLFAAIALADVAPPEDYVETCTEKVCPKGSEVRTCSAYYASREDCEKLEAEGFKAQCRTRGASVWSEVLCKAPGAAPSDVVAPVPPDPPKPADPPPPAPAPARVDPPTESPKCATSPGTSGLGIAFLAAVTALRGIRRRRPGLRSTS